MPVYKRDEIHGFIDRNGKVWCTDCLSINEVKWEEMDVIMLEDLDDHIYICDEHHEEL